MLEQVSADSLIVTHIFDGEEVVTGGVDGQVWVATFADSRIAQLFISRVKTAGYRIFGERRQPPSPQR